MLNPKGGDGNKAKVIAAITALLTFIVYWPATKNGFVNWDDPSYVSENPAIQSLSLDMLRWSFTSFHAGNWHPLTWLSHALDFSIWGMNPMGHHLTNNFIHAANTFLLTLLMAKLVRLNVSGPDTDGKWSTPLVTAFVGGLFFGVHPLHVESVAWIAERKDVLCAFFYFLSLLFYVSRQELIEIKGEDALKGFCSGDRLLYIAFFFFILALMSKPMAVSLPVVLLIFDWYPGDRLRGLKSAAKCFVEKIPFIMASMISAAVTVLAQHSSKAVVPLDLMPLPARLLVGVKSLAVYLLKTFFPINLIPLYPYPPQDEISALSAGYMFSIAAVIAISAVAYFLTKRNRKTLAALWMCHCVLLLPVIGIVQVGGQAMADRYAYLPSAGWSLLAGYSVLWVGGAFSPWKNFVFGWKALVVAITAGLAYVSIQQIKVWESGMSLWNYVIARQKGNIAVAYYNRGLIHGENDNLDAAIADFTEVIRLNARFDMAYNNRGTAFFMKQNLSSALADYTAAITFNPGNVESYVNRGMLLLDLNNRNAGIADLQKGCALGNSTGCELLGKIR